MEAGQGARQGLPIRSTHSGVRGRQTQSERAAERVVLQGATSRAPQGVTCREQVAEPDKGLREGERSRWSNSCPLPLPPLGPWRREGVGGVGGGGAAIMIAGTAVTALALLSLGCWDGGGTADAGAQP